MKQGILISILALSINVAFAQSLSLPKTPPQGLPLSLPGMEITQGMTQPVAPSTDTLQFNDIALGNLLTIIFNEVLNKNFVLSPRVLQENRFVSFRYTKGKDGSLEPFLSTFLKSLGYELSIKNGVYYVQDPTEKQAEDFDYYIYRPKHREANYIIDTVRSYFGDNFKAEVKAIQSDQKVNQSNINPNSALANIDRSLDIITFRYENAKQKNKIMSLIEQLDKPEENIIVKAYIYEVSYSTEDGSAIGLILNIANQKLKINVGSPEPLTNFVNFSSNALGILFSNINTDTRFKLLSNPYLRVKNNKQSSFNVGQSVPTLGSISYQGNNGIPVQEVKYIDTGLSFQLTPQIKGESIDIDLVSEISEAQNTTTGLNNTPTLTKRKLTSNFTTKRNEVVMLAGLTTYKKNENTSMPFALPFFKNKNQSNQNTEIIVFLETINTTKE